MLLAVASSGIAAGVVFARVAAAPPAMNGTAAAAQRQSLLDRLDLAAIMVHDFDGRIRYWSAGCQALYGWTSEEATGQSAAALLQTDFPSPLLEIEAALLREGSWSGELRHRTKNGAEVVVLARKVLQRDEDGTLAVTENVTDITALRRTEAALADSESCFRGMIEALPVAAYTTDPRGYVQHYNRAAAALAGRSLQPNRERWCVSWKLYQADGSPVPLDESPMSTLLREGHDMPGVEVVAERPDGSRLSLLAHPTLLRDTTGRVVGALNVLIDMTARKQAETALAETSERLRLALDAGRMGLWSWDLGTDRLTWDARQFELFGFDPASGQPTAAQVFACVHPADLPGLQDAINAALEAGDGGFSHEFRVLQPDGAARWVASHGRAVPGPDGRATRMEGLNFDAIVRRNAESALVENQARLALALKSARMGVHEIDLARGTYRLDAALAQMIDLPVPPDVWRLLDDDPWREALARIHPEDASRRWDLLERLSLGDDSQPEVDFRTTRRDGSLVWLHQRFTIAERDPVTGGARRLLGLTQDVTEARGGQEALERLVDARTRELREAHARLAHTERLQALGQLAGGIAHDFNNVLQAVQAGSSVLERRRDRPDEVRRIANLIKEAADRGTAVTSRLLTFSRRADLRAEPIDVAPLLHGIKAMLAHTLGTGIEIRVRTPRRLPPLVADKAQLETALVNLATNSRDAMNDMGVLTLTAAEIEVPHATRLRGDLMLKSGHYIHLSVTDSGCGMDAATLTRVTEPFFTTKPQGKGTGLGLAMAKGFSEQSGGGIHIESAPEAGTTVHLYFPSAEAAVLPQKDGDAPKTLLTDKGVRVLLVDDDAVVRATVQDQMEDLGFLVSACESGHEALERLDSGEAVDVVVSDLSMPVMDGLTLIREAKRRRPGLPAMLLTGFSTNIADITDEIDRPFLLAHKPISGSTFIAHVASLLDQRAETAADVEHLAAQESERAMAG